MKYLPYHDYEWLNEKVIESLKKIINRLEKVIRANSNFLKM